MLLLTRPTDARWVETALENLDAVLIDHAHCEMKAASNALALAARAMHAPQIVRPLIELAEEEMLHFRMVLDELDRRGLKLGPPPPDPYARKLRTLAHEHPTPIRPPLGPLVDRLLVGCLIEARSCERFRLLADALAERGPEDLAKFYADLFAAEARHFRTFVDLANEVLGDRKAVRARLEQLAEGEGEIVARLVNEPEVHG